MRHFQFIAPALLAFAALLMAGSTSCNSDRNVGKVTLPAGSSVVVSLEDRLGTDTSRPGDPFRAATLEPIRAGGRIVLGPGARVIGSIVDVAKNGDDARITLSFDQIVDPKGGTYLVETKPITFRAQGGRISVDPHTPPGAGESLVITMNGRDIDLPPGQKLRMELTEPIVLRTLAAHLVAD